MSRLYQEGHRELQRQFDTERLADRLEQVTYHTRITPEDREFIERRDMFFLATADAEGRPNCSYKGGDPGFVRVLDESTLVFPNYDGNGMFLSFGNTRMNPHVGLLFIDFEAGKRIRVNGTASIEPPTAVEPAYPQAQFIVKVQVREVFPELPALHPQVPAGGALEVRAAPERCHAGAGVETLRMGERRAAGGRSGERRSEASADLRARLGDPHLAPAVRVDELAGEDIAGTPLVAFLAGQLQTVRAVRALLVLRHLVRVDFLGVVHVAHRDRERVLLVEMRRRALRGGITTRPAAAMRRVLPRRSSELYDDRSGGRS